MLTKQQPKKLKMKRLAFSILLLLPFAINSMAQSDYKNGYIITNENDTIYGLINNRGYVKNAEECTFKAKQDSETINYSPDMIQAYRFIDGKYYVSKKIKVDEIESQVFLEYLIDGILDIYFYRENEKESYNSGDYYFIDNGDGELQFLNNKSYDVFASVWDNNTDPKTIYRKESKRYIGLLKLMTKDSPTLSKKVDNIKLSHKSLTNLAKEYHEEVCPDDMCIIYEKVEQKIDFKFGPIIDLNMSKLISTIDEFPSWLYYFEGSDFNYSIYPSIGLFCKFDMPTIHEKLYFQFDGVFNKRTYKTTNYWTFPTISHTKVNQITISQNSIKASAHVGYEFSGEKIRLTYLVGGFFNYYIKTDYKRAYSEIWDSDSNIGLSYETNDSPFSKHEYGFSLGLGLIMKNKNDKEMSTTLRYQRGYGLFDMYNFFSTNNLSLSYTLQANK